MMVLDAIKEAVREFEWNYNHDLDYFDEMGQLYQNTPIDMSPICQYIDELKEKYNEKSLKEDVFQTPSANGNTLLRFQNGNNMEVICQTSNEWDNRYDSFLNKNVDAQAICKALQDINSPHIPKTERGYWWTFYLVLTEIKWAETKIGNKKLVLQWANQHFNCGWDWSKAHQFKFTGINKGIIKTPISQWSKTTTKSSVGLYYGELAKQMKAAFVEEVNGGKLMDRMQFIKRGCQRINNGH